MEAWLTLARKIRKIKNLTWRKVQRWHGLQHGVLTPVPFYMTILALFSSMWCFHPQSGSKMAAVVPGIPYLDWKTYRVGIGLISSYKRNVSQQTSFCVLLPTPGHMLALNKSSVRGHHDWHIQSKIHSESEGRAPLATCGGKILR